MTAPRAKPQKVEAYPEKDFFVSMITRDINTRECVLDLIDNAVDGSKRPGIKPTGGGNFFIELQLANTSFSIRDNCGGISVETAKSYAFHFGKRRGAPPATGGIGMYGIGMKRAMFKLGRQIDIESSTATEAFDMSIDVDKWLGAQDWELALQVRLRNPNEPAGTKIVVKKLNAGIGAELVDNFTIDEIKRVIAKVYSRQIKDGLQIRVNGIEVSAYPFELRVSPQVKPIKKKFKVGEVTVQVTAGLGGLPPEDDSADYKPTKGEHWGWYVLCNGRVVLAGDKTDKTGWGVDNFTSWHNQYNGFLGVIEFSSKDPNDLPWTTTKADVDTSSPLYRRALREMRDAAQAYVNYTTHRKGDLDKARHFEKQTVPKPIAELKTSEKMKLPSISGAPDVAVVNISYTETKARVKAMARALGDPAMPGRTIGKKTFEYCYHREVRE